MAGNNNKPRVLLITRNFPPLTGGMERLMHQAVLGMSHYTELTILGPRGCGAHCPAGMKVIELPSALGPFLLHSTWHAAKACRKHRFNLLLGGSGIIAPTLLLLRILFGGKSLVFLHGLDLVVKNSVYQNFFIPCIRKADRVVANSINTLQIAVKKGVPEQHITVVNPGTYLPDLVNIESRNHFLNRRNIPFKKIMIFVGRITKRKGLSQFIQHSLPLIFASEPEAGLIIVGENPDQGLTKMGEAKEVEALVSQLDFGPRIRFLGRLKDKDLETCYAAADVHIFPLVEIPGDVEGFGMVAIEAAACGTPTVAFSTGGVTDAVSTLSGRLVAPGRYDLFADEVIRTLNDGMPDKQQCVNHAHQFSWSIYNGKIERVIRSIN